MLKCYNIFGECCRFRLQYIPGRGSMILLIGKGSPMSTEMKAVAYEVVDNQTRKVVGTFKPANRVRARRMADRKDMEYGAIRYIVRPVWAEVVS